MTAKTLMIQGTGSGVGKSVITAAFCRRFYLDGWRVAPFKAQNMSLNSFVTEDGGEMGRAQVYQAEACGLKPHVAMNPILLKPCGDNLSQVIVLGKVTENRDARDYYSHRGKYLKPVKDAFDYLRKNYDLVVLEGAGSPAEINLKEMDFVNMHMAKIARTPVLVVGDIDRGGVFAWMKGTYDLLDEEEQKLVAGFIINKFRGDIELLKPGIRMFEDKVQKPVVGVIPFYHDLLVDEEDDMPFSADPGAVSPDGDTLDVAVIRLPRISNFTDMTPLTREPGVSVRYVRRAPQLRDPDLIIIPGSKNTLGDLRFMKETKLDQAIIECHRSGTVILGICAGFQILGRSIHDPWNVESARKKEAGLGLLDFATTLDKQKITRQSTLRTCDSPFFKQGLTVRGYEIHMGVTKFHTPYPPLFASENGADPRCSGIADDGLVGTYLHGFFDEDELRVEFLRSIRRHRGLPDVSSNLKYKAFREKQLDRLAEMVDRHIDMKKIKELLKTRSVNFSR
ncbi:MAG: cobyric acid synthase [Nitrospinales bacterium]